jgi:hypothetical protein
MVVPSPVDTAVEQDWADQGLVKMAATTKMNVKNMKSFFRLCQFLLSLCIFKKKYTLLNPPVG